MPKRESLHFDFDGIWTAQGDTWGWKIFSPKSEEIGFVQDDGYAYFATSELLGIRSVQRNSVAKAVFVIAYEWNNQQEVKKKLDKKRH
jgi:hypothetical protein